MHTHKKVISKKHSLLVVMLLFCMQIGFGGVNDSISALKSGYDKAKVHLHASRNLIDKHIDSASLFLKKAKELFPVITNYASQKENRLKAELLILEGDILVKVGKLNDAKLIFYDLLTRFKEHILIKENADAYLQLGVISDYQSQPVAALKYYEKAYKIFDSLNYIKGTSECFNNMGIIYYRQGEVDKGIEYLEKCLAIRKAAQESNSSIAVLLENLGSMYLNTAR